MRQFPRTRDDSQFKKHSECSPYYFRQGLSLVRLGGLEPPTLCLKGRCSTTELQPLPKSITNYKFLITNKFSTRSLHSAHNTTPHSKHFALDTLYSSYPDTFNLFSALNSFPFAFANSVPCSVEISFIAFAFAARALCTSISSFDSIVSASIDILLL